jgi:uncharacterized protein (TIGR02679 family)
VTEAVASAVRVRALLGGAEYARLFAAARARFEEGGEAARSVTLAELGEDERRALAGLAGWDTVPAGPVRVDLARLDRALRDSAAGASLREVLHVLGGPLRDRRAERRGRREALERMWRAAHQAVDEEERPDLRRWIDGLKASGALARAAQAARREPADLLESALRISFQLPARGELLAVFAARTAGDPHALDAGAPLGGVVLRAAAAIAGLREGPASSSGRRRLWRDVGIDCDSLSADVLVLGLRPDGDGLVARHLRESADAGDPRRVTLRDITRTPLALETGAVVHVCENPAVVEAAADALGPRSAPLVCVEGVPSTAALALLKATAAGGARLRVHADLDWAGLRIAAQVLAEAGGSPWRMSAADYRTALALCGHGPSLGGRRTQAAWDPDLAPAMLEGGRAVLEEQVLEVLLGDLERKAGPSGSRPHP